MSFGVVELHIENPHRTIFCDYDFLVCSPSQNINYFQNIPIIEMELEMGRKFTEIDEEFICENCGAKVKPLGYSCRNHCPKCLYSKHVDINPGDREETCHGILEPIGAEIDSKKGYVIIFRCKKCGIIRRNKAAKDDNMDLIIKLTARH